MTGSELQKFAGSVCRLKAMRLFVAAAMVTLVATTACAGEMMWTFLRDGTAPGEPPARDGAVCWKLNDGSVYLFGAHESNEIWKYDPAVNQWSVVKPGQPVSYGTCGVSASTNAPSARYGAVSWTGSDGTLLYLFGGVSNHGYLNDLWRYDVATNQWTWLKGANTPHQYGNYGTLGVAAPGNTPGSRVGAVSWTGSDGALYLFGGYGYTSLGYDVRDLNDLWRYDVATSQWTWLKGASFSGQSGVYGTQGVAAPDNTPGARSEAVSWTGSDGAPYLFGGSLMNDLWRYDVATNQWTWLKGANNDRHVGIYGTQGVAAPTNTPGSRDGAVSWTGSDGALYLFGGSGLDAKAGRDLNDLWRYDVVTNQWTWLKGSDITNGYGVYGAPGVYGTKGAPAPGNTPGARYDAISWSGSDGALYLFGGYGYATSGLTGSLYDLWRYDVVTNQWTWLKGANTPAQYGVYGAQGVPDMTNAPIVRSEAVSWTGSDGALYLFGGEGGVPITSATYAYLNDLWRYDVAMNQWTWLKGANSFNQHSVYGTQGMAAPGNTPDARSNAVSWTGPDGSLYLFGGLDDAASGSGFCNYLNDLWRYDIATNQWTWLKGANTTGQSGVYGTQGVAAADNTPGARSNAVSWTGSDGALYLFGGINGTVSDTAGLNDLWRYDVATNRWTWLKGGNTVNQPGIYGTQGVAAADNTPGARYSAVSWAGSDGSLYLFGGYSLLYGARDDLWRYDVATNQWTWLKGANTAGQVSVYGTQGVAASDNTPGARWGAVSWTGSDGALYLFGGNIQRFYGALSDLWRYDVVTNEWTWLKGATATGQSGVYDTQGIPAPGNTPGARYRTVSWSGSDGALYLFGGTGFPASVGSGGASSGQNDLWRFMTSRFGALTVTLQPAGAISAGARWRRVGTTTWLASGATETSVPAGRQTIEFKGVAGYTKPVNQSVTVQEYQTATATGIYNASSSFTMVKDDPFDAGNLSTTGWTTFGASSGVAASNVIDYDVWGGAYRIRTFSVAAGKWHNAGISNNRPDWIPYDSVGTSNYVRAKFYIYAQSDGSTGWSLNDIPSFAMRLTYRFAFWAQLFVNPHESTAMPYAGDLRPSIDPAKPSIYRVDFDPIDVPYLSTYSQASGKEGIGATFEVFETGNTARGSLCMTELVTGVYPVSALSGTPAQSKVYDGTRDAVAGDLHRFVSTDATFANLVPAGTAGDDGTTLDYTAGQLITYSESAKGFAMSSSAVPTTRYGSGEVTFHAGVNGAASNATRVRVREGEVYKARFHITSTQQTSAQACIWLNTKSVGTAYISYLQMMGGASASGSGALRQALPGVGNANRDRNTGDTNGGWYTVIMSSPLNRDIASDRTGTTIEQLMPNLALQPAPGVDAGSRRDIKVGVRMWDSLSSNGALDVKASEVGQFTIDRIEVTAYPQFGD